MALSKLNRSNVIALALALVLGLGLSPVEYSTNAVFAADDKPKPKKRKTKVIESMKPAFAKELQKAAELNETEDFNGVLKILDRLKRNYDKYNTTERANLWQFYAFVYYQLEQPQKAVSAYKSLLGVPEVAEKAEALYKGTLYSLSQMYFLLENYRDAVATLERWFEVTAEPGATAYILLGQGYYQLENYSKALPAVEKAIAMNTASGKEVKENWYLLVRAMYYTQEDYQKTFDVLRILVEKFPKKQYYSQLSAMYGQLGKDYEQYSSIMAMNDAKMLDKSAELVTYAQFLLQNDRPYRAAKILEDGFKAKKVERKESNLKLLANAWMISREDKKAIPVLEEAAKLSDTGDIYQSLAQSYMNVEDWNKALRAVNNAFKKGKLKRPDSAHIIRGMILFNLSRYDASMSAFQKAKKDKRSRKTANQWLRYVKGEKARADAIAKGLS